MTGNGQSSKPNIFDRSTWWSVDDHLNKDMPAVITYVLQQTGAKQVHWMGHSMGGMLACGLLSQQGKLANTIRSLTLIASGCFGIGSFHSYLKPLIHTITGLGFPAGSVCQLLSLFSNTPISLSLFETLFFWRSNMSPKMHKRLLAKCFSYIPVCVIRQFMGSLNTVSGLSSADSSFLYADPNVLKNVDVPVFGLNGNWDLFCPAAGGWKTVQMFGSTHKRFMFLGPQYGTAANHYGHFDIVAGDHVHEEVYPHLAAWLDEHDTPIESTTLPSY